jgi:iron complex outermembrane receptor protein
VVAQVNYFYANFSNRLLAFPQGASIQGNTATLANVGGVTTNGVDAAATVQLGTGISLYNGATFNKSTYDDDIPNVVTSAGTVTYVTKGKVVVDAPKGLYKTELAWRKNNFFANVSTDYMSKRYFTYSNDGNVDGRFLENFALGYERAQWGEARDLKIKFNIYNLTCDKYYSAVGTNGLSYSDPLSVANNTLQLGSPRTFTGQVSLRF